MCSVYFPIIALSAPGVGAPIFHILLILLVAPISWGLMPHLWAHVRGVPSAADSEPESAGLSGAPDRGWLSCSSAGLVGHAECPLGAGVKVFHCPSLWGCRPCSGSWGPAPASPRHGPQACVLCVMLGPARPPGTPSGRPGCCRDVSVPVGFSLELSSECRSTGVTLVQCFSALKEVCLFVLVSWESSRLAVDPVWEGQPLPGWAPCSAVGLQAFPGVPAGPREAVMVAHGLGHHLKGLSSSGLSFLTILSHSFSHKGVEA